MTSEQPTPSAFADLIERLGAAIALDAQNASAREWTILLAEAVNALDALRTLAAENERMREALRLTIEHPGNTSFARQALEKNSDGK